MALLEQLRDEFLSRLEWSDKATDDQKQLVNNNVKSFTMFLAGRLGNAVTQREPVVKPEGPATPAKAEASVVMRKDGDNGYSEHTSPEVAALAARGLRDPGSLTPAEVKSICASALTQAGGDPIPPQATG